MTNKLQVTSEQSVALDTYVGHNGTSLIHFETSRTGWGNIYKSIKNLSIDEMATALFVGYEIEKAPERGLEVGDWVTTARDGTYLDTHKDIKVAKVSEVDGYYLKLDGPGGSFTADYLRLANPNEIFWAKLGRGTNELRYGDVIVIGKNAIYHITEDAYFDDELTMEAAGEDLGAGRIKKLFPAESMLEMPSVK